jgi:LPS export ABC transporter permease LptG/LPS export ABC transporter permease LptF
MARGPFTAAEGRVLASGGVNRLAGLRPTLLDRYVAREVLPPTGLGLLLFTFILVLDQISQLMKILVSRGADLQTVVRAFLYLLPSIFSVTIPMAFLLGVLLAFGRMASDSEIVALRASGVSPLRLLRSVGALSAVAMAVTFYVVAHALPAANQAYRELIFSLVISKAKSGMQARVFNDDLIPGIVIYVSDIDPQTGEWRNVFMHDNRVPQKPKVVVARTGRLDIDRALKKVEIDLQSGDIYTFSGFTPTAYDRLDFQEHNWPLPFEQFFPVIPLAKGDREMTLAELKGMIAELKSQGKGPVDWYRYDVEYHKKFAIAGACVVFGLLGLGLSLGSKKEARSAAFGLSVAVIFVYYVLIRLGEQAGDTGMLQPWLAMWAANMVLGAIAVFLLALNQREAAFDPLDPSHYKALLPGIRRREAPTVEAPARRPPGARGGPRKVVVLRIPRWVVPLPGLLDRYIVRSYLGKFGLVLTAFWALFVLVNFMDLFDDVQHNRVKGIVVMHYYTYFSPQILHLITPVGVLVSVLITFGILARRNEITAMKAAGISIYRATLPALALGLLVSAGMFTLAEFILPTVNKIAMQDYNVIKGRPPQASTTNQQRWILGSDGRIYHYDYLEERSEGSSLYGLTIYDVAAQRWELRDILYAARAAWNGVSYDLERGWRRTFLPQPAFREIAQGRTREIESPSYFAQEERPADTLRFGELRRHIASLELLGLDVTPLKVQLHRKLAFPVVCVVMTMLGIPFAFVVARRGALYGIAASVLIAIVYWACLAIFEALGNHALLPPFLAAWAPNLLFGGGGLYLMFTLET